MRPDLCPDCGERLNACACPEGDGESCTDRDCCEQPAPRRAGTPDELALMELL